MGRGIADSNVILRYLEGSEDLGWIFTEHDVYYNDIIFSEVLYSAIRHKTGRRPYDIKRSPESILEAEKEIVAIKAFFRKHMTLLPITEEIVEMATMYMIKYKLLPNDALILATAEGYGLDYVITKDKDLLKVANTKVRILPPEKLL